MTDKPQPDLLRRNWLRSAGAGLVAAGLGASGEATAAMKDAPRTLNMADDGSYATVPLAKDTVTLSVAQTRVRAVDGRNPRAGLKANLEHLLKSVDKVFHFRAPSDIVQFHEFPITGWDTWTRKEALRLAIEVPGEETEKIGAKAREYGCWIVFGSYVVDPDWPRHLLSVTTIIGPDGAVVDKHWKPRNIKGVFPNVELFTTTIYDVLDAYVEMYGPDAVIPVTRTPVGNLATTPVQREPELFRAYAMKGAELLLRTATGGFSDIDAFASAYYNGIYATMCNNAVSPGNPNFFDDADARMGGSLIIGPRGEELARAREAETAISARIPLAAFRARHRQPVVHKALYDDVLAGYRNPYGPNLFSDYLPTDLQDAKRYLKDKSRWQ
ncbi:MAG: nitrilase-related carbon-nitrogen hydrolase [Pseudomonadota bacterium]